MTAVVHIAGQPVRVGNQHRQRCSWCGAVIDEVDLAGLMVPTDQADHGYPTWEVGALVAVDGGHRYVVDHNDGDILPPGSCGLLPHDVTGTRS